MGYRLKAMPTADGSILSEKACENYCCRSCGARMISVNFVNGICIQVFVTHKDKCAFYNDEVRHRTADVTCETCVYCDSGTSGCTFDGEGDSVIAAMHL